MKRILFTLLVVLAHPAVSNAETVVMSDLGELSLRFKPVEAIDSYTGQPMAARVSFRQGEAVSLVTPHRVQQITYLVPPGQTVAAGQAIAVMSGPEVHHFITEFDVTEQRLETAKKRFESNRKLYQKKAIDEGRWMEISEAYYTLQLEFEHMLHFRELLETNASNPESITLNAPAQGILQYQQDSPGIDSGEELALLLPQDTLRLKVSVPLAQRSGLSSLVSGNCQLQVESISGIARDFFVQAWSEPLSEQCDFLPGQRLMVTPVFNFRGYRVPREAVFQWQGETAVLLRQGQNLTSVSVEILSSDAQTYAVACPTEIAGGEVLASSVSAVQGVLMGLGGE